MQKIKYRIKGICMYLFICIFMISIVKIQAEAIEDVSMMQYTANESYIQMYVSGLENVTTMSGQVGRSAIEVKQETEQTAVHTIVLIDNSLSITKDNQKKINDILTEYFNSKSENERVSLAVYGEDIMYLAENENETEKLIECLTQVVYENQDSYLTDILYDEMEKMKAEGKYTRFIVATDGVDNKAIGYTKEELTEYLKENNYPIYTLGCIYKNNTEELENLFALARLTNADYFLIDEYEEYGEIISGITEKITEIRFEVPEECRDGSEQNVLITFETEDGSIKLTEKMKMPFQVEEKKEEVEEEPHVEEEIILEPEPEEIVVEVSQEEIPEPQMDLVSLIAIVVIVVAIIVLLVMKVLSKRKKTGKPISIESNENDDKTVILNQDDMQEEENYTVRLEKKAEQYKVILQDRREPERKFSYPLMNGKIIVGRLREAGVQIALNYNSSVSKKHCKIYVVNGCFYVEDLKSSNGTYINNVRIYDSSEVKNGDIIKLGELEMIFTIESLD